MHLEEMHRKREDLTVESCCSPVSRSEPAGLDAHSGLCRRLVAIPVVF